MSAWPDPAVLAQRCRPVDTGIRINQRVTYESKQTQLAVKLEARVIHRASVDSHENPQGRRVKLAQPLLGALLNLVGTRKGEHMPRTCRIDAQLRSDEVVKHVTATDHAKGIVHAVPISWW